MARGNWQRRVERTQARRTAEKLQKEVRRNKRNSSGGGGGSGGDHGDSKTSYRQLEEWFEDKGDGIGMLCADGDDDDNDDGDDVDNDGGCSEQNTSSLEEVDRSSGGSHGGNGSNCTIVDIWTDARPENRPEYIPIPNYSQVGGDHGDHHFDDYDYEDEDTNGRNGKGNRSKGKQKEKKRQHPKKNKGKAHPNANKNKSSQESMESSSSGGISSRERSGSIRNDDKKLCSREFFHGYKGNHQQFKQPARHSKGGRKGSKGRSDSFGGDGDNNDGCNNLRYYHQLPKVKRKQKGKSSSSSSPSPPMTLWQVLNGKYPPHHIQHHHGSEENDDNKPLRPMSSLPPRTREAVLKSSFDNAVNNGAEDPDGASSGIDMVYHSRFLVDNKVDSVDGDGGDDGNQDNHDGSNSDDGNDEDEDSGNNNTNNTQRSNAHATLQNFLSGEKLPIASIVYLAIQGILVYDRHRGGMVLSPKEERFLLYGDAIPDDDVVVDGAIDENLEGRHRHENNEPAMHVHEQMTHHLLDEIFSYADDGGPAVLSRVCKSWRDEVGTRSPQLWNMLLGRRDWPETVDGASGDGVDDDDYDALEECRRRKAAFVSHYAAVRDVRALRDACSSMAGGSGSSSARGSGDERNHAKLEEYALQIFKSTKGAPAIPKNSHQTSIVRIWYDPYEASSTRALVAYEDFTLRLFEVDRSSSSSNNNNNNSGSKSSQGSSSRSTAVVGAGAKIRCRQVVCVRAAPTSISGKKDDCMLTSMELDDETVACIILVLEHGGRSIGSYVESAIPWMTVFSREDVVCAGNEGLLDDASVRSFNLREEVVQFLARSNSNDDDDNDGTLREKFQEGRLPAEVVGLQDYLAAHDGDTSDVEIKMTPKLVACGKGHFLFHAFLRIPEFSELQPNNGENLSDLEDPIWVPESRGHRLFLFSAKDKRIVTSLPLERYREGTSLFASRPFKCSVTSDATNNNNSALPSLCTNVLISGPTMEPLLTRVEIRRDGSKTLGPLQKLLTREHPQQGLSPWSRMDAVLTSSHAIFSTDPIQGPVLHFQRIETPHHEDGSSIGYHSIDLGGRDCKLRNMFLLREHYVAVVIGTCSLDDELEEEDELFDGHWFGHDETSLEMIVYHTATCREIYRTSVSSNEALSADCIGDTLAANVSHLGFVITGGNARDVARSVASEEENSSNNLTMMGSPGGKKTPKVKKKRLVSGASGRKKDGFARGMSHGG